MSKQLDHAITIKHQREREATRKLMVYFDMIARKRVEEKAK